MTATVADVLRGDAPYALHHGDGVAWLDSLPAESIDAVICDLPYAEIDRDYGRMTELEWEVFAHAMVRAALRVLTPRGSAVWIIQPNSERLGRMRAWAFRFMAWCAGDLVRETGGRVGMVQDAYWWNTSSPPTAHSQRVVGLMRGAVKPEVWIGPEDCYRDQGEVLWRESDDNAAARSASRALRVMPSGLSMRQQRCAEAALERGGVTPFNLLPLPAADSTTSAGAEGHGAGTPYDLAAWWTRYLCPVGGVVADPCMGAATMGLAAVRQSRRFIGSERMAEHFARAERRMARCDLDAISPIAAPSADFGPLFGGSL